jgi:prepilin peptidase CpaA
MPLHLAGGLAAGDVKLMAVAAAWLGPTAGLHAVLATWVAGGVLALVYRFAARASSLPYAPAIAVGSLLSGWRVVASA